MNLYTCHLCGKTVERERDEDFIRSYCAAKGRTTLIWKLAREDNE